MRYITIYDCVYILFFQAEDGIRDADVTGVQTCALPIWVEDRLYYALNAPKPPQDIQQLDNAEIITHMGYNYPEFERYFAASKAARIDQYTNAEMLKALYASPRGSRRYMIKIGRAHV